MKTMFENVIARGSFDLNKILTKIDEYHIEGKLTDEEKTELYSKARGVATPKYDFNKEIEEIWKAIRELQKGSAEDVTPEEDMEWPEFVQPSGGHDAYMKDEGVTFNGERYISTIDNNVWSPATYPAGWDKVVD